MQIQFKKGRNGQNTLACIREDGSSTWSRLYPSFIQHDLAHFAIENVLDLRESFYGLIRSGWDIPEFEARHKEEGLPLEAMQTEFIVNLLLVELAQGQVFDRFNTILQTNCESKDIPPPPPISNEQLAKIRQKFDQSLADWRQLPLGEKLTLPFSIEN